MKRILVVLLATFTLMVVAVTGASAAPAIVIPIDTVVYAPAGSTTRLAVADVPENLVGYSCVGFARAVNQESVHPNNDLILTSGGTNSVLHDVEGAPYEVIEASGTLVLGETVTVDLLMGEDGVFSGGMEIVIDTNCSAPTTTTTTSTSTTTTTSPTTTTVPSVPPAIDIVKTANAEYYGSDGVGSFTIVVTNPGPVDLFDVYVTDDVAVAIDPASDCPTTIGDLAVGESKTYSCTVANLDGTSPFENEATAIGVDVTGTQVTDTDTAVVFPPVLASTITQAPPTTTGSTDTLPVTGIDSEHMRSFGLVGLSLLLFGIVALGGAAVLGQHRRQS